jgi:hypothetical protein
MKMAQQRLLKLSEVIIDKDLYPRMHSDYITVAKYVNAMKAGAVFPPIIVAKMDDGRHLLIDGKHRIEATKGCKETHIQATIETGLTEQQVYREAVIANSKHGKPFTTQEVTQIAITMQDMDMSLQEISEIIRIPVDRIERFVAKSIVRISETGKNVAIKKPLRNVLAGLPVSQNENIQSKQMRLDGRSQLNMVDALVSLFKNGLVEDSEQLRRRLGVLHRYIESHLEDHGVKFDRGSEKKSKKKK